MVMERGRSSRNRSWGYPHRVCYVSTWTAFHFRDYENYFCRPLTSLLSSFGEFQIRVTSPPRQSSLVSPCRLVWNYLGWNSNPLYLALRGKADDCLLSHAPSSQLSVDFHSKGPVNTWRISWPGSIPLYSTAWE